MEKLWCNTGSYKMWCLDSDGERKGDGEEDREKVREGGRAGGREGVSERGRGGGRKGRPRK